jgi:uncharacterized membrane protein
MMSGHFPFTYGHERAWLILIVLMALGAWTRHFFNLRHRGRNAWWILATAAAGVAVLAVLIRPDPTPSSAGGQAPSLAEVERIVEQRCTPCHATSPTQPGFAAPGAGILLETREQIEAQAALIKAVAVDTQTMPLANATNMTDAERDALARWLASR